MIIWTLGGVGGLTQSRSIDIKVAEIKSMMPKVRSVCEHPATGALLIGTRGGEIMEFPPAAAGAAAPKPVIHMRSHYEGELWGLATHPTKEEFITIG